MIYLILEGTTRGGGLGEAICQTDQDIVENVLNSDDEGFLDLVEFHMFFSNLLPSMALLAGRRTGGMGMGRSGPSYLKFEGF